MANTIANAKAQYDELNERFEPLAKTIKEAGSDFDFSTLDIEGTSAVEKSESFNSLVAQREAAKAEYDSLIAAEKSAKEAVLAQPVTDSIQVSDISKQATVSGLKAQLDEQGGMREGRVFTMPYTQLGQKAAFALNPSTGVARPNDRVTAANFPSTMILNAFNRTNPMDSTLVVHDMTAGGQAHPTARTNSTDVTEATNTAVTRSYPIQAIVAQQGMSKVIKNDNGRLATMLETILGSQVSDNELTQVLQGGGSSPNWSGLVTQALKTSAVAASTKILSYYEGEIVSMRENNVDPDALIIDIASWTKVRQSFFFLKYPYNGMDQGVGFGAILGVPIYVTSKLSANTHFLGNFGIYGELAVREDVSVQVYEGPLAAKDQDLYVARLEGCLGQWQAYNGDGASVRKYTTTNNFVVES